ARLQVSLGPVPDVSGMTEGKARSTLEGVGLVAADPSGSEPSDTVDEGRVIRVDGIPENGWLAPNSTLTLVVSTGPPLFAVPDLTGMTLAEARDAVTALGFTLEYDDRWDSFPDAFTQVESQSPKDGTMKPKGTEVSVRIGATL
ncbi:MAG TPA: PASTA domain-containing protein, partial [Agromyces sp.]